MSSTHALRLTLSVVLVAGCDRGTTAPAAAPPAPAAEPPRAAKPPAPSLDQRTPLPLTAMMANHQKVQMRDHLRVVQEISGALAVDDFDKIAASAARIAWSEEDAMMCEHMGAGAPGFAELGERFHHTADTIIAAAGRQDRAGVATALEATLASCVGCHDTYRQEIVEDAAAPHDMAMHGH